MGDHITRLVMTAAAAAVVLLQPAFGRAEAAPPAVPPPVVHDGSHDFDFLIGDWKAHVRRLPDRLVGSTRWIDYDGVSKHHKLLDSNANFEEFEVSNAAGDHLKAQTLRLYNPQTHEWSIYGLDVNAGTLAGPPQVGVFTGGMGQFYAQDVWKGRTVYIRYQWSSRAPNEAHMEQAFSVDAGKTWEVNWICELTR
jgi:hypothetical protein